MEHMRRSAEVKPPDDAGELDRGAAVRRAREPDGDVRLGVGRLRRRAEVPALAGARVPAAPRASPTSSRRRSTRWRSAACTTSSAAASTATRSTTSGSCRTSRRCSTTTRCSPSSYLHGFQVIGKERYREVTEQTVDYMLRELALDGGGLASAQDADTDGVEGLTFTWKRDGNVPDQFLNIFEGDRFIIRGELDDELRAELLAMRERAAAAGARRQGDRVVERPRARGARRVRARARPRRLDRRGARRSPSSCSGRCRPRAVGCTAPGATGVAKGTGYLDDYANVANGLLRAARRDGRAALARGVEPPRAARGRALRRRRERRLLRDAVRRRAARRPQEGLRRPPGAERQRDARLRAAAAVAHLRRRRARGARGLVLQARSRTR